MMHCVNIYCIVRGRSSGSFIVVPTGADVTGTNSILSLILSLFALMLRSSLPLSPSRGVFFYPSPFFCLDQMERCSAPNLSHSGSQCSQSCDPVCYFLPLSLSLSLSLSIHKCSFFSFFLSILSPLTKPDKGLSFLLACLSSVCLYCTKVVSLSHCILSLSLQRRCLGAAGALLWDKGPASAQRGRWQGWEGVCVVSERTRGRRKSKSDRVYYFINCFGARQGLGSKTLQLCVWQGRDLPQPGNSIHTHCAAFIWYWGCVRALSHWCWLARWGC